jgi:Holliday junction resolvase
MIRARVDANQAKLVALLRKLGFSVQHLHAVGRGVPDLMLGAHGVNYLVEVKDGSKPPSARLLNPAQVAWHAEWKGQAVVIESEEGALAWAARVGAML